MTGRPRPKHRIRTHDESRCTEAALAGACGGEGGLERGEASLAVADGLDRRHGGAVEGWERQEAGVEGKVGEAPCFGEVARYEDGARAAPALAAAEFGAGETLGEAEMGEESFVEDGGWGKKAARAVDVNENVVSGMAAMIVDDAHSVSPH